MSAQRRTPPAEPALSTTASRLEDEARPPVAPRGSSHVRSNGHGADGGESGTGGFLTPADVDAIAEATARKLVAIVGEPLKTFGLVGPRDVAEALGVSLDYVYAHAAELGAMRLGSGPKARIRFDLDRAR